MIGKVRRKDLVTIPVTLEKHQALMLDAIAARRGIDSEALIKEWISVSLDDVQ